MTFPDPNAARNRTLAAVYPTLRGFARRVSRTPADADDLAQDAAVLFLRRWHRFDGRHPGAFARFAVRSARQYAAQRLRARPAPAPLAEDFDPPARGDGTPPAERAEEEAARAAEVARLRAAVAALPERRRHVITARFGLDGAAPRQFKELAGGLGVSKQAVEQQQAKALAQLAAALSTPTQEPAHVA